MTNSIDNKIKLLAWLVIFLTAIHLLNSFLNNRLSTFGIYPGSVRTLPHIIFAPFIHGSWGHLLNNLFGITVFSSLCLLRGIGFYLRSSLFIIVVTGIIVWLFGRPAFHIGASGWIFGLWSLSIAMAWFQRKFFNIVIALFVVIFYGGMVFGVLPGRAEVSFESHLAGALAGILCAWVMTNRTPGQRGKKRGG